MTTEFHIQQLFEKFIEIGNDPKVTEFKRYIDRLIKTEIKPLCVRSGKSSESTSWRDVQKANFAGRGAKWVKLKSEDIELTLQRFETDGIDCTEYRSWVAQAGYAWVRYAGPRIQNGVGQAAFEVRTEGSKINHPKQLYYMNDNNLMEHIESLGGTPHALGLEVINVSADEDVDAGVSEDSPSEVEAEEVVCLDEAHAEVEQAYETEEVEAEDVVTVPVSDDPAEWEAFLEAEGLGAELEGEGEDIFGEF